MSTNFVSALDRVVTLGIPGKSGRGEINGFTPQDRMIMRLLRPVVDAVIAGSSTLKSVRSDRKISAAEILTTHRNTEEMRKETREYTK